MLLVNDNKIYDKNSLKLSFFNTAVITAASSSVSAPLYTLVNFTCEGKGGALSWTVEGNLLTSSVRRSIIRGLSLGSQTRNVDCQFATLDNLNFLLK